MKAKNIKEITEEARRKKAIEYNYDPEKDVGLLVLKTILAFLIGILLGLIFIWIVLEFTIPGFGFNFIGFD